MSNQLDKLKNENQSMETEMLKYMSQSQLQELLSFPSEEITDDKIASVMSDER